MKQFDPNKISIFIGSSTLGKSKAEQAKNLFKEVGEVVVWFDDFFEMNESYLQSLLTYINFFDFAVLIMSPDDVRIKQKISSRVPRDNIIFELGLFLGKLGKNATFALREKSVAVPSDLSGIHQAIYNRNDNSSFIAACELIKERMLFENQIPKFRLSPSGVIGGFYYSNFIVPLLAHVLNKGLVLKVGNGAPQLVNPSFTYTLNIILFDRLNKFSLPMFNQLAKEREWEPVSIEVGLRHFVAFGALKDLSTKKHLDIYDIPTALYYLKDGLPAEIIANELSGDLRAISLYEKSQLVNFVKSIEYRVNTQHPHLKSFIQFQNV